MPNTHKNILYTTCTLFKNGKQVGRTELFNPNGHFMGIVVNGKVVYGRKENDAFVDEEFHDCKIRIPTAEKLSFPKISNQYDRNGKWTGYNYEEAKIIVQTKHFRTIEDACQQKRQIGLTELSSWKYAQQIGPWPRTVAHLGYLDRHKNLIIVRTRE